MTTLMLKKTDWHDIFEIQFQDVLRPENSIAIFSRMLGVNLLNIPVGGTDEEWDEEPSELTLALQHSLDRNSENTTLPETIARIQSKAIKDNQ